MGTEIMNEPGDEEWVHLHYGGEGVGKVYTFGNGRNTVEIKASTLHPYFMPTGKSDE